MDAEGLSSLLDLLGVLAWSWIIWRVASHAMGRRRQTVPAPAAAGGDSQLLRVQAERSRQMMLRALGWASAYALSPQRVVNLVILNIEGLSMETASNDVREAAALCYSEGRCRGQEFTRFVAGQPLAPGEVLVFLAVAESDLLQHWYALVVPRRYLQQAVSARIGKVVG